MQSNGYSFLFTDIETVPELLSNSYKIIYIMC